MNEKYKDAVDRLINDDPKVWAWIRRRARKHYEVFNNDEELEGSSDVSGHVYNLWKEWYANHRCKRDTWAISCGFGFWINGEIIDKMDLPRNKVTESYHNWERA